MSNHTRILLFTLLVSMSIPHHSFAIEDTISGIATSAGDLAKGVGQKVGIGVPCISGKPVYDKNNFMQAARKEGVLCVERERET